jgi:putative DNA methylase
MEAQGRRIELNVRTGAPPSHAEVSSGTVKASSVTCPACDSSMPAKDVRDYGKSIGFGHRLYAVLDIHDGARTYRNPSADEIDGAQVLVSTLLDDMPEAVDGTSALPDELIPRSQFRIMRSLVYGIDTFRGLFNERQLYVLGILCETVRAAYSEMIAANVSNDRAKALATYLA